MLLDGQAEEEPLLGDHVQQLGQTDNKENHSNITSVDQNNADTTVHVCKHMQTSTEQIKQASFFHYQKREEEATSPKEMAKENVSSEKMKLILALLALQFCFAGFHIVSRLALNIGVSKIVFPVYRNTIALFLLGPAAYFLEKKERPPLTFTLLLQFFLLAFVGITANQGFYLLGLNYASPTFASAMQNSVPAITFLMATALGVEQVHVNRRDGLAKIIGTVACVGGATIITLFKGPLLHQNLTLGGAMGMKNWTWGCIYLLGHCVSWASWMVLQAPLLKKYPAKLTLTSFTCFFGLLQFLTIAAFTENDLNKWVIHSWEELSTILYAGIVSSGVVISLQTWCIHRGGPVYVAVFQPVQTVLVAAMATIIFRDHLFSGGILGSVLIMLGLYIVLWGKAEETRIENQEKEDTLTKHLLDAETCSQRQGKGSLSSDIP